jgi:hypothetical protein
MNGRPALPRAGRLFSFAPCFSGGRHVVLAGAAMNSVMPPVAFHSWMGITFGAISAKSILIRTHKEASVQMLFNDDRQKSSSSYEFRGRRTDCGSRS